MASSTQFFVKSDLVVWRNRFLRITLLHPISLFSIENSTLPGSLCQISIGKIHRIPKVKSRDHFVVDRVVHQRDLNRTDKSIVGGSEVEPRNWRFYLVGDLIIGGDKVDEKTTGSCGNREFW